MPVPGFNFAIGVAADYARKKRDAANNPQTGNGSPAATDLLSYPRPPARDLNSSPEDLGRIRSAALNSLTPGSLDNTDANATATATVDLSDPILERRRRLRTMGGGSASYQSLFNANGNLF